MRQHYFECKSDSDVILDNLRSSESVVMDPEALFVGSKELLKFDLFDS